MTKLCAAVALSAGVVASAAVPVGAQSIDFRWSGSVATTGTVSVRGVNGEIRAEASGDGLVYVEADKSARRSDLDSVRIEVVEHAGGVTVCAVYPGSRSRANDPCSGGGNARDNDVRVNFFVRVPAGVRLEATTVNGDIDARGQRGEVQATTVNGDISVETSSSVASITTVNGSIVLDLPPDLSADFHGSTVNGRIYSDFPILLNGGFSRRSAAGTIGRGGPALRATTVNGNISLRQR
jgi:hypothetical protein